MTKQTQTAPRKGTKMRKTFDRMKREKGLTVKECKKLWGYGGSDIKSTAAYFAKKYAFRHETVERDNGETAHRLVPIEA